MKLRPIVTLLAAILPFTAHAEMLSLHAAWQRAQQGEPGWRIAQADAEVDRQEENKVLANLLPSVRLNSSLNRSASDYPGSGATAATSTSSTTASNSLLLNQSVFRMQNFTEYRRASVRSALAATRLQGESQNLALRVAQAYFDALLAMDSLRFAQFQENSLRTQLDSARKSFRAGSGTRIDVDEAKARLAIVTANRLAADNNRISALKNLSTLVGAPIDEIVPLDENRARDLKLSPASHDEWLELARRNNPELIVATKAIEEAAWAVDTARSGHLPTLDFSASQTNSSINPASTSTAQNASAVGLQLNIPLFAGGYTTADTTQANARYQRTLAAKESTSRQIESSVLREYNGFIQGEERLNSLAVAYDSSLEALRSTRRGVDAGTRTSLDVLNAESQAYNVRLQKSQARYELIKNRLRLQQLAGRLDEAEIKEINSLLGLTTPSEPSEEAQTAYPTVPSPQREIPRDPPRTSGQPRSSRSSEDLVAAKKRREIIAAPLLAAPLSPPTPATKDHRDIPPVPKPPAVKPSITAEQTPVESAPLITTPASSTAATQTAKDETADRSSGGIVGFLKNLFSPRQTPEESLPTVAVASSTTPSPTTNIEAAPPGAIESATAAAVEPPNAIKVVDAPSRQPTPTAVKTPPPRRAALTPLPSTPATRNPTPLKISAPATPLPTPKAAPTLAAAPVIAPRGNGQHVVALGAYDDAENIVRLVAAVEKAGVAVYTEPLLFGRTRVRAGPFATRKEAEAAMNVLKNRKISGVVDKR